MLKAVRETAGLTLPVSVHSWGHLDRDGRILMHQSFVRERMTAAYLFGLNSIYDAVEAISATNPRPLAICGAIGLAALSTYNATQAAFHRTELNQVIAAQQQSGNEAY